MSFRRDKVLSSEDPQLEQKLRLKGLSLAVAQSSYVFNMSSPHVNLIWSAGMNEFQAMAEPVDLRQLTQWQSALNIGSAVTSYLIWPHKHEPV